MQSHDPIAAPIGSNPLRGASLGIQRAAQASLSGRRRGIRAVWPFIGPAFIAAVAYVDPGNYATNIQGGASFGYNLLWVVLLANLMAMLMQSLSAKLGIATGRNLPELCGQHFTRPVVYIMWIVSEVAAMATDLAEFLGASLGLYLLLHIPLLIATLITGVVTYGLLLFDKKGFRPLELLIGGLVTVIAVCYIAETFLSRPNWNLVAYHSVVPWIGSQSALLLSVGIIGATIMPHAVYLHSGLTQNRIRPKTPDEARRIHRFETVDVIVAMTVAGIVNMAMLCMAASAFHRPGFNGVADITTAYHTLTPLLGPLAAGVFLTSLLASGFSSSAVGTMAGQVIMQGFVGFTIPVWLRRVVTMVPTIIVVAIGVDPTRALVLSQVVLSLALPFPLVALLKFTDRREIMGVLVNTKLVSMLAKLLTAVIIGLNVWLLLQVFGIRI